MATNTQLANVAANAAANAVAALLNGGSLNFYSGPQPATCDTALGVGNVLLATLTFSATAFVAAAAGVIVANAITSSTGTVAAGAGTVATFVRMLTSGAAAVMDEAVGTSGSNFNGVSTAIVSGEAVVISGYQFSILKAGN